MTQKQLVKNSLTYVTLGFLPLAVNLFLAPLYSSYISPEEYGMVALATIFQSLLSVVIGMGLDGAFSRLYFDYFKKEELVNALMSTVLISIILISILLGLAMLVLGNTLFELVLNNEKFTYTKYGQFVFFTSFSTIIHTVFLSYYRNVENVKSYSLVALSFFFSSVVGIVLGVVYFKAEALGNIAGRAIGTSLISSILIFVFFLRHRFTFKLSYLKQCFTYSLPLVPYLLILAAYNNVDKYMVEQFFQLETLGLYNFAFLLASVISVLIYSMFNALSPRIYKLLTEGVRTSLGEARNINSVFHLVVVGLICLGIALIIPIIRLVIASGYHSIENYIAILILVYVFQLYYVLYTIPIFYAKKTKILPWASLGVLIAGVLSNYLFIPYFGILGVCLALVCTKLTQFLIVFVYVSYCEKNMTYLALGKNHLITLIILVLFGSLFILNHKLEVVPHFILNTVPIIVYLALSIAFFRPEIKSISKLIPKSN